MFLIDQSGSMADMMSPGKSKAQHVADVLNRTLATLITRCTRSEGVRDYFDIGVIGYGASVGNGFEGPLSGSILQAVSAIEAAPLRIEDRQKKQDDGAGGLVEVSSIPIESRCAGVVHVASAVGFGAGAVWSQWYMGQHGELPTPFGFLAFSGPFEVLGNGRFTALG